MTHPSQAPLPAGIALLAGAGVGLLVACAAVLAHAPLVSTLFGTLLQDYPYVAAGAILSLVLGVTACVVWHDRMWQQRTPAVIALIMLTSHFTALSLGPLSPLAIAVLVAFGLWLLEFLGRDAALPPSAFRTLAILFFACVLLSMIGAHPSEVLGGSISFLPKLVLAIIIAELLDDRSKVSFAVSAMVWTAGLLAVVGLAQVGAHFFFQVEYSFVEPYFRYAQTPFGPLLRASGFASTAHQFALPIGLACVMSAYFALTLAGYGRRLMFAVLALVTAGAVALSIFRGMWVATLVGLLLVPVIAKPRLAPVWVGLVFVASVIAIASGIVGWVIQSVVSLSESGVTERVELLSAGLKAMLELPTGTGINNFASVSPTFERYPVHNAVVEAGSELGLPGFAVFIAILGWIAWRLFRALSAAPDTQTRVQVGALFAGYIVLVIAIQSGPMAFSQFLWIYLGLAEAAARTAINT